MAVLSKIKLPNNVSYDLKDANAVAQTSIATSISSSSTDSQVPSAKCMYDICGDIESILEALL